MRFDRKLCAGAVALAAIWATSSAAQNDPSNSTPAPAAGDGIIHLHMPDAQTDDGTIHLHPLRHQAAKAAASPQADATVTQPAETASAPASPPAPGHAKASHSGSTPATIPFNFGDEAGTPPPDSGEATPPVSPSLKTASIPPHRAAPSSDDEHAGLSKHGAVLFEKGATDPSPAQFQGVKLLAGDLSTALESGASRIQLEAYGGSPGDKSSDARRLSLKRALAVRQLLIDNGVPSNRIDVRAMGGADDKGPTDRVDVFVRAS